MRVAELKALSRELGLRGYSRLRKAELIALLQNNPPPPPPPRKRPPKPTRPALRRPPPPPPPPPPPQRFKPYHLKAKRDVIEPPIEEQPTDPKKLKRMKKKLDELNRKIRHSRKKHDGMIHKRNALRKAIEDLTRGTKPEPVPKPEWNFKECEQAFRGAYRSYRVNGRPKMDVDTFFSRIREN